MKTYTPSESELEEMGFKSYKLYFILDVHDTRIVYWNDNMLAGLHGRWNIFAREDSESEDSLFAKVYPRNKKHLLDMIKLFSPNEK